LGSSENSDKGIPIFQSGGSVPDTAQFQNDGMVARLSAGEEVIDRNTAEKLDMYLNSQASGGGAGGGPTQINISIGEQQLASVMLNLNRQGFRTA